MTEGYDWCGRLVLDAGDEKLGNVDEIYLDPGTGQSERALVHTGLFGSRSHFVPLAGAPPGVTGWEVRVGVSKDQVIGAPSIESEGKLSENEERCLFEHYGLPYDQGGKDATALRDRHLVSWRTSAGQSRARLGDRGCLRSRPAR